ncbi:hypothetical protein OIDMADRAFT_28695 [Oidiodendron maius Zn]|uniref:Protein-lysine N-methyltransferase EFM5 n=1 Tax=Oidiodendron maius (strain Zn) TaxID=913774 RepID=A0A0C3GY11_OIDMZ|nr:hypothetical protein OIDMADRAFT_28695 [Oidiodendron maius Zn]
MSADDDDDEIPVLSSSALDALKEFYADRDAQEQRFEDLRAEAEQRTLSMDDFAEDWNESQFWYADETATMLAEELLSGADEKTVIAVISAPSVFVQIKNILTTQWQDKPRPKVWLMEFDKRFEVFKDDFVFYDFHNPLKLPLEMKATADRIICDPPFLSEDCQTKAAMTARWLSKSWGNPTPSSRVIVCTGERMESLITKLYRPQDVRTTTYEPRHSKGLSNEFLCYANFECERWTWKGRGPDALAPS